MDPFVMLGAAAARVLCKLWLGDHTLAGNVGGTVTDLIAVKISDRRERKRTESLFDEIEFTVADRCAALLDAEFGDVADNERTAAVMAVGATLDSARLTGADLFAADLDARLLERHVRAGAADPTRDLASGAHALYDHVLSTSCAYIIELSRELRTFEVGAVSALLTRQTELLTRQTEIQAGQTAIQAYLETLLKRVPVPNTRPDTGDPAAERFTLDYRRAVANRLDHLELFGISVTEPFRRYPLTTAYVSLAIESPALRDRLAARRDHARRLDGVPVGHYADGALRCEDVLHAASRLLLRGEAGTGKTTLLQWLAVRAARREFPPELSALNEVIPFVIKLRRYVKSELPRPEEFIMEAVANFAAEMPDGWVHDLLRSGRALVLVDGIDELPERRRKEARTWLNRLVTDFPKARYVVTSRPAAVAGSWLNREDFDVAELQPMTPEDIRRFVRKWHEACDASPDRAQTLIATIDARSHLRELAATPLLCAMLCALNADRREHLPHDRMELYGASLAMLLGRRDDERDVVADAPALTVREMTLLLQEFAYWLLHNGQSDAARAETVGQVAKALRTIPRLRDVAAEDVFKQLLVRSGVLREPVTDRVDFAHRTFQEYLAGKAAVEADNIGALINCAGDDQWFQTIILAAGHARPEQRTRLLRGLLDRAFTPPAVSVKLHILTVACLETAVSLEPALSAEIHALAEELVPPRSTVVANALAKVGEPVLDLLADRPPRNRDEAAETIRCARQIGGRNALSPIACAGRRQSRRVHTELLAAWSYFDADEYAEHVLSGSVADIRVKTARQQNALSRLRGLKSVVIDAPDGCGDIGFVTVNPELRRLIVGADPRLDDISVLADHPSLVRLSLMNVGPVDVTPVLDLPALKGLFVSIAHVRNGGVIRHRRGLRMLSLFDVPAGDAITAFLPESANLDRFWVFDHDGPLDMRTLNSASSLRGVTNLDFTRCSGLSALDGIEAWQATLKSLHLYHDAGLTSLEPLADLHSLKRLSIVHSTPIDLSPLRELHDLVRVDLIDMAPGQIDLSSLDAPNLRELRLYGSGDVDLRPLAGFADLEVVVDRDQQVTGAGLLGDRSVIVRF